MRTPIVINVIDTPGHADFGGEVERGLSMVDGVVLLVDASEGPLPQTRFVLRKALAAKLPVILLINKTDRADARIDGVVEEAQDLLLGLASDLADEVPDLDVDAVLDVPVVFAAAKAGAASLEQPADGEVPDNPDLEPLFKTILETIPAPEINSDGILQAHVTNLDASPFLGRLALLRIFGGTLKKGQQVAWARGDDISSVKITELLETQGLDRVPATEASAGDIVAVAGIPDIMIGDTLTDINDPKPMPAIIIDDPAISMTVGINTSPLAGREKGTKVTARHGQGPSSTRSSSATSRSRSSRPSTPDTWRCRGAVNSHWPSSSTDAGEDFELTVGKPQVVTKQVDGKLHEPFEELHDRRSGGLPRCRDPAARRPQGCDGDHDQPRHRLGAHGIQGSPRVVSSDSAPVSSPRLAAPALRTRSPPDTPRGPATSSLPASTARSSPTAQEWSPRTR